jgi:hypothetical protein
VRFTSLFVLCLLLAGCGTDGSFVSPIGTSSSVNPATGELRSQPTLSVTPNAEVGTETLGAAVAGSVLGAQVSTLGLPGTGTVFGPGNTALLFIIYDPLAPNWTIKEKRLNADTYYLFLRAKSFRTGGDGEAIQIVKRRALQLQREKGYAGYRILDYSEGIESSTPLTHRVSEGTIQLVKAQLPERR